MILKKKFVSVYVSSSKLKIVELSGNKKKIQKFFSLDLPQGLISNFRVTNPRALGQALAAVWKKIGLKEKTIAVVIPEFSSLIKTFELPKIDDTDLDEAVRWHAVDFLPDDSKNFILDWKIVGESADKYQILCASIDKSVLDGYILAVKEAGLLPMMVETPSLCLTNLLDDSPKGRLIIYQSTEETLLVISSGKKIVGSSVVNPKSAEELILTIQRMLKYYSTITLSEILIGGGSLKQNLVPGIEKKFGIKSLELSPGISGLAPEEIQDYLIPTASQLRDVNEPSDENTINLLPPDLVKEYAKEKLKLSIWTLTLFITLIVWFSFTSTLVVYFYLGSSVFVNSSSYTSSNTASDEAGVVNDVKNINSLSQKVIAISGATQSSEKVLNAIYMSKPVGITITDYFIDFETGEIRLKGLSTDRVKLVDFKYKLEENSDFSLVSIPISSFEQEKDFDFEMNFTYLPARSTKQPVKNFK